MDPGRVARSFLLFLATASGFCGLSWELLWQQQISLALGVSARAAAITLAVTMAGMGVGASLMGRWLDRRPAQNAFAPYAAVEAAIGIAGVALIPLFTWLSHLDSAVYRDSSMLAATLSIAGPVAIIGPPALAMGATIPIFRRFAANGGPPLAHLYAANTGGAAVGVLLVAFGLLPLLGVRDTSHTIVAVNVLVGAAALGLRRHLPTPAAELDGRSDVMSAPALRDDLIVLATGFATFAFEVAWFRSLRAAFYSTTDAFALMLVSVLVPLAAGAHLARRLQRNSLAPLLAVGAVMALLATPVVDRFDLLLATGGSWAALLGRRVAASLVVLGLPMVAVGTVLPLLLDRTDSPRHAGRLYALNTVGSVAGAIAAGWLLLPAVGFARTAWIAAAVVMLAALLVARRKAITAAVAVAALAVAVITDSGAGRRRVQGPHLKPDTHRVLFSEEGPDATVSVVAHDTGIRELVIDGFQTSGEARQGHYMAWMGRLPMLLHPAPKRALVICFGTGQTANGVRREGSEQLDIVELSPAVIRAAPLFTSNEAVLEDPRTRVIVMDGRAWLRRTDAVYDVITLEPMAPYFAGTNALYSVEFYQLAERRLARGGVLAQWLPMHIVTPTDGASIARTVQAVFAETYLWIDPVDRTGILLARKSDRPRDGLPPPLALDRPTPGRDLTDQQIRAGFLMDPRAVTRLGLYGQLITDDNQLLAYGNGRQQMHEARYSDFAHQTALSLYRKIAAGQLGP